MEVARPVGCDLGDPVGGRAPADLAEHGVDQPGRTTTDALVDEVDARRDRGVVGHPHGQQLVGAEPQHVTHLDLELRLRQARVDHRVVEPLHPDRAGRQLGGQRGVATLEPVLAEHLWQHEVGVGPVGPHGGQDVEGRVPGAVDRPAALTHRGAPAPASWGPWSPTRR